MKRPRQTMSRVRLTRSSAPSISPVVAQGRRTGTGRRDDKGLPGVVQVKLLPDAPTAALLLRTVQTLHAACNWLAFRAFEARCADPDLLRERHYRDLRERFGLQAQFALQVIARVVGAYVRDPETRPTFRREGAFALVHKDLWTCPRTRPGIVSLATLDGRRDVPYRVGEGQRALFEAAASGRTEADLSYRHGRWFLAPVTRHPRPMPLVATGTLGVDLGIVHLAVDSDGEVFTGAEVERVRQYHLERRRSLQREKAARSHRNRAAAAKTRTHAIKKRTRSLRKKLAATGDKEARFRRNENHRISKRLVDKAQGTDRRLALEDLQGLAARTTVRSPQRARHAGWAYAQLGSFIAYKAARRGVGVLVVPARGTSTTCPDPACRHRARENRASRDLFRCVRCGLTAPADWVGARNVQLTADVMQPIVPRDDREHPTPRRTLGPETPRSAGTSPGL